MVCLDLFENSAKDQTLRTLIALAIIVVTDIIYSYLTNFNKLVDFGPIKIPEILSENKIAHVNVWITLAVVFGVSVLHHNLGDKPEINNDTIKDHAYYGILIGLLVYTPMYGWLLSCGKITNIMSLCNSAFGILLSALACLCTFLISVQTGLFD